MGQSNIISAAAAGPLPKRNDDCMGAILVEAGRLRPEDVDRIVRLQRQQGLRFGEAGTELALLSEADVEFALARQFDYSHLRYGEGRLSEMVVAAYAPFDSAAESLRALRSEIMLHWAEADPRRRTLAVLSAGHGDGRSFIAANLAVVFSQLGEHTLLIDGDMRNPRQHALFGLENRVGLSTLLSGRSAPDAIQRVGGLARLSVLPAGPQPPNPLELLARPMLPQVLQEFSQDYDVVIVDTPPAGRYADAQTVAARSATALIVARRNASRISQVRRLADCAARAGTTVLGTVLNDF
jgi:protein-tyrosine kinase